MAGRAVALGILCAFLAQLALPAVMAARERPAHPAVAGHGSHHGSAHHHPGCPWRENGPCPHHADDDGRGPALSACADAPAATVAAKSLIVASGRVLDWSLTPPKTRGPEVALGLDATAVPLIPEPPPPRPAPAS